MPDLPTIAGGPSETASVPASTDGVALSSSGTAHVKGGWTELIASVAYDANWLLIHPMQTGSVTRFLFDVGVGPATAETVLVPNLYLEIVSTFAVPSYLLPLRVARGTRLSARQQSLSSANTMQVGITAIATPIAAPPGLTRVEACGIVGGSTQLTSIDPGATANTDSAWVELIAATSFAYRWLLIGLGHTAGAIGSGLRWLIDLAVGASGAEQALVSDLLAHGHPNSDQTLPNVIALPIAVAAGSRIAARGRASSGADTTRDFDIAVWGGG